MAQRDSSLLFSLKELEGLEHERVARERREKAERDEAAHRARGEAESKAREAEARRIEDEQARLLAAAHARAEEAARLAALQRGIVERARAETEARAQADLARSRDAHELALAEARARTASRRDRLLLAASVAALAVVTVLAGVLAARLRDVTRLEAERAIVASREREGCERAVSALGSSRRELDELARQLEELARTRRADAPSSAPSEHGAVKVPGRAGDHPAAVKSRRLAACTGDGDPLNGCLPAHP